ncbi:hypothetical protein EVAR_46596_1 [Eumeta japonica]|uniref:Uncharacterized protein n=1 Tax=Eumeta variegata TaxID=151549 RepID=A0A4C1WSP1_EUMVA|nr:hypothetical protein EVAR_46596_1 [Eumeta japonica]
MTSFQRTLLRFYRTDYRLLEEREAFFVLNSLPIVGSMVREPRRTADAPPAPPVDHRGVENKEMEVELFTGGANVDIPCITEYWLKNFQLLFGFADHRVASSFSKEGSMHIDTWCAASAKTKASPELTIPQAVPMRTIYIKLIQYPICVFKTPSEIDLEA